MWGYCKKLIQKNSGDQLDHHEDKWGERSLRNQNIELSKSAWLNYSHTSLLPQIQNTVRKELIGILSLRAAQRVIPALAFECSPPHREIKFSIIEAAINAINDGERDLQNSMNSLKLPIRISGDRIYSLLSLPVAKDMHWLLYGLEGALDALKEGGNDSALISSFVLEDAYAMTTGKFMHLPPQDNSASCRAVHLDLKMVNDLREDLLNAPLWHDLSPPLVWRDAISEIKIHKNKVSDEKSEALISFVHGVSLQEGWRMIPHRKPVESLSDEEIIKSLGIRILREISVQRQLSLGLRAVYRVLPIILLRLEDFTSDPSSTNTIVRAAQGVLDLEYLVKRNIDARTIYARIEDAHNKIEPVLLDWARSRVRNSFGDILNDDFDHCSFSELNSKFDRIKELVGVDSDFDVLGPMLSAFRHAEHILRNIKNDVIDAPHQSSGNVSSVEVSLENTKINNYLFDFPIPHGFEYNEVWSTVTALVSETIEKALRQAIKSDLSHYLKNAIAVDVKEKNWTDGTEHSLWPDGCPRSVTNALAVVVPLLPEREGNMLLEMHSIDLAAIKANLGLHQ